MVSSGHFVLFSILFVLDLFNFARCEICLSSVCEYTFEIQWEQTMTYKPPNERNSYNLDLDGDRLRMINSTYFYEWIDPIGTYVDNVTSDVITADGVKRNVITINGQFPGPTIEVAEGSQVVVHVKNQLVFEGVTVHWHGISQLYTPWMDGSGDITQCPIIPGKSFTYRFVASPAGTHWYHSHYVNQRLDGLYGAFIVHKTVPEIPSIPLIFSDWFHVESKQIELDNVYGEYSGPGEMFGFLHNRLYSVDGHEITALQYTSGLINGRGRYDDRKLPLTTFNVERGQRYRLRLICASAEYPFEISIDNHKLWAVAVDGTEIQPLEVTTVVLNPGETMDIEIEADQAVGQYWIRATILTNEYFSPFTFGEKPEPTVEMILEVKAIMRYENAVSAGDPTSTSYTCSEANICKILNCPFSAYPMGDHKECISIASAMSLEKDVKAHKSTFGLEDQDFEEHFFNFGFNWGSSVNGNKFLFPPKPFSQGHMIPKEMTCAKESCVGPNVGCVCTNVHELPFNKTIQLVLTNLEPDDNSFPYLGPHPIHIHGHNFAVLKMGFPDINATTAGFIDHTNDIICPNRLCKTPRWNGAPPSSLNFENPPIKDTVVVPARGYVVIRFRSNNPGYWLMHCHAVTHHMEGMNMVFKEAPERISPVPENFPTCDNFLMSSNQFDSYMAASKELVRTGMGPKNDFDMNGNSGGTGSSGVGESNVGEEVEKETKDNEITVDIKVVVGFAAGCIAVGAVLVLLPLCIYLACRRSKGM